MTVEKVAQGIPQSVGPRAYNRGMNKTKADLPLILADYTEFVNQQQRRWAAMRAEVATGTEILTPEPENPQQAWFAKWEATRPQGQWGRWHISDRD